MGESQPNFPTTAAADVTRVCFVVASFMLVGCQNLKVVERLLSNGEPAQRCIWVELGIDRSITFQKYLPDLTSFYATEIRNDTTSGDQIVVRAIGSSSADADGYIGKLLITPKPARGPYAVGLDTLGARTDSSRKRERENLATRVHRISKVRDQHTFIRPWLVAISLGLSDAPPQCRKTALLASDLIDEAPDAIPTNLKLTGIDFYLLDVPIGQDAQAAQKRIDHLSTELKAHGAQAVFTRSAGDHPTFDDLRGSSADSVTTQNHRQRGGDDL